MERFHFHQCDQEMDESVTQYVAELRCLARCVFQWDYLEEVLRDWFVEGDIKLSKAVEIAQSMEATNIQAQALYTPAATNLAVGAITSEPTPQPEMPVSFTSSPTTDQCCWTGHLLSVLGAGLPLV